ncbi:hypothetical protein ACHAXR_007915 [Thalassiosira sp. AJA248-18]
MPTVKFTYKGKTAYVDDITHETTEDALFEAARKNFKVKSGYTLHIMYKGKKIAEEILQGEDLITYSSPAFPQGADLTLGAQVTVIGTNPSKQKAKTKQDPNKFCDDGVWGTYEGEKDPKGYRHGKGKLISEDGEIYEGEWKDDKQDGEGGCRYANGAIYEGEFKRGKREGKGTYYCANGDKYVGQYKANLRNGQGTYFISSTGNTFVGTHVSGKVNGLGTYYWRDGNVDIGKYKGENAIVTAVGGGVRWSQDRKTAWSLQNGKEIKEVGVAEAREIASQMGFPGVPP